MAAAEDPSKKYDQEFFIALALKGKDAWNAWRRDPANGKVRVTFVGIDFSEAPRDRIDFSGFEFGDNANFSQCKWRGIKSREFKLVRARFTAAAFGDRATFTGAALGDKASFTGVAFGDKASFSGVAFGRFTNFRDAAFGNAAEFSGATFGEQASFDCAAVGDGAIFDDAAFGKAILYLTCPAARYMVDSIRSYPCPGPFFPPLILTAKQPLTPMSKRVFGRTVVFARIVA
jgi:uncharacterized protein YjbI with pentapeptide repeats